MSKPKAENGQQLAVQQEPSAFLLFDAPYSDSLSDDEIEALMMQEPVNQIFQLPAEEQPIEENEDAEY